jgi:peptidoglycan/LPS O-acetylase OafA/YrhL
LVHDHVKATLVEVVFPRLGWPMPDSEIVTFLLFSAASIGVAAASWHFFEKPLNDLKRHFRYVERRPSGTASPEAAKPRTADESEVVSKPVIP